jgi:hypothetical protein
MPYFSHFKEVTLDAEWRMDFKRAREEAGR